eukprot:Clim_evm12s99 gene=Clim_evmTU12s99
MTFLTNLTTRTVASVTRQGAVRAFSVSAFQRLPNSGSARKPEGTEMYGEYNWGYQTEEEVKDHYNLVKDCPEKRKLDPTVKIGGYEMVGFEYEAEEEVLKRWEGMKHYSPKQPSMERMRNYEMAGFDDVSEDVVKARFEAIKTYSPFLPKYGDQFDVVGSYTWDEAEVDVKDRAKKIEQK